MRGGPSGRGRESLSLSGGGVIYSKIAVQARARFRLISVPPIQACCQHAWCLACVELCPLGREGSMLGGQITLTHAMAKQLPLL